MRASPLPNVCAWRVNREKMERKQDRWEKTEKGQTRIEKKRFTPVEDMDESGTVEETVEDPSRACAQAVKRGSQRTRFFTEKTRIETNSKKNDVRAKGECVFLVQF